jgi:hypothetical protein
VEDINERLKSFDNSKLIDIVKNYRQYKYDDTLRNTAIDILKSRGIGENDLKLTGNFENRQYTFAGEIAQSYSGNSKIAFLFYGVFLVSKILLSLSRRTPETFGWIFLSITLLSMVLFLIFLVKSFINQKDFYKTIGKDLGTGDQLIYFIVGMPLYILMYFYYRNQMMQEKKLIK